MPSLEWIKLTCDLPDKWQTRRVARLLKLKVDEVVGKLFRFWVHAENQSNAGFFPRLDAADLDDWIGKKGFAVALAEVGWLAITSEGLRVPRFSEHMGAASRERDGAAERKRREREAARLAAVTAADFVGDRAVTPDCDCHEGDGYPDVTDDGRERDAGVTSAVTHPGQSRDGGVTEPGPKKEKEREKKEENPQPPPDGGTGDLPPAKPAAKPKKADPGPETVPIPTPLDTSDFRATWAKWIAARKAQRKPMTANAAEMQLRKLAELGPALAAECIGHSIANDYQGLIFEKFQPGKPPGGPPFKSKLDRELDFITGQLADLLPPAPADPPVTLPGDPP